MFIADANATLELLQFSLQGIAGNCASGCLHTSGQVNGRP